MDESDPMGLLEKWDVTKKITVTILNIWQFPADAQKSIIVHPNHVDIHWNVVKCEFGSVCVHCAFGQD